MYPYDLQNPSRVLPGPERIHVSQFLKEGESAPESIDGARTLYESFLLGAKRAGLCVIYLGVESSKENDMDVKVTGTAWGRESRRTDRFAGSPITRLVMSQRIRK